MNTRVNHIDGHEISRAKLPVFDPMVWAAIAKCGTCDSYNEEEGSLVGRCGATAIGDYPGRIVDPHDGFCELHPLAQRSPMSDDEKRKFLALELRRIAELMEE